MMLQSALENVGLASYVSAADAWCTEAGPAFFQELLEDFNDLCEVLGAPAQAQRRQLHLALCTAGSRSRPEPVPGLRDALAAAGLTSQIAMVESWCLEVGAGFLLELLENMDDLCKALGGISPSQKRKLREALSRGPNRLQSLQQAASVHLPRTASVMYRPVMQTAALR